MYMYMYVKRGTDGLQRRADSKRLVQESRAAVLWAHAQWFLPEPCALAANKPPFVTLGSSSKLSCFV